MPTHQERKIDGLHARRRARAEDPRHGHQKAGVVPVSRTMRWLYPAADGVLRVEVADRHAAVPMLSALQLVAQVSVTDEPFCQHCGAGWAALEATGFLPPCDDEWAGEQVEVLDWEGMADKARQYAEADAEAARKVGDADIGVLGAEASAADVPADAQPLWEEELAPTAALRAVITAWQQHDYGFCERHLPGYELYSRPGDIEDCERRKLAPPPPITLGAWPPERDKDHARAVDGLLTVLADRQAEREEKLEREG